MEEMPVTVSEWVGRRHVRVRPYIYIYIYVRHDHVLTNKLSAYFIYNLKLVLLKMNNDNFAIYKKKKKI